MNDTQALPEAAHITDETFKSTIDAAAGKPVIVDFYATWCGPCQVSGPIIDRLSAEYADKAVIVKLDVDENPETAGAYRVMSIPTVIIFKKDGEEVKVIDTKIGFPGEPVYRQMIEKAVGVVAAA